MYISDDLLGMRKQSNIFVSNLKMLTNVTNNTKFRKITFFLNHRMKISLIYSLHFLPACILSISSFNSLLTSFPVGTIEG